MKPNTQDRIATLNKILDGGRATKPQSIRWGAKD